VADANNKHYDLVVIGSGPGGYVGAIRAGQLGLKTACIERDKLGGVCLNWGCIPSKALLHTAELYMEAIRHGNEWGFSFEKVKVDWEKVIGRSRDITGIMNNGISYLFKKNNVDHIAGHATVVSGRSGEQPCKIDVHEPKGDYYHGTGEKKKDTITADNVIIACGAAPNELPFAKFDGKTILSSYDALTIPKQPKSMVVIGSGAIGMEFAYFFNAFETKVDVVEMLPRILPAEDEEISKQANRIFSKQGMTFHTGHVADSIENKKGGGKVVTIKKTDDESKTTKLECDVVLVAIGVSARSEGLVDKNLGLEIEKGHIKTDYFTADEPTYQTSVPGVYAIGDVIGPPWLAHKASEEAIICVERMAGHKPLSIDYQAIPACTYCNPQIASIGMTEAEVKEKGIECTVGKYQLKAHGKAVAVGSAEGMVKMIASKPYGEILGAHIIGEDASELIAEMGIAKRLEATAEDIISTVHAHPTMAESIHEAALGTEGRMIHA